MNLKEPKLLIQKMTMNIAGITPQDGSAVAMKNHNLKKHKLNSHRLKNQNKTLSKKSIKHRANLQKTLKMSQQIKVNWNLKLKLLKMIRKSQNRLKATPGIIHPAGLVAKHNLQNKLKTKRKLKLAES